MDDLEVKDRVRTLHGERNGHKWYVETVVNARTGEFYAVVELDGRVSSTKDFEREEDAKNAGCHVLATWIGQIEGGENGA